MSVKYNYRNQNSCKSIQTDSSNTMWPVFFDGGGGGQNTCINQRTFMHREILHLNTYRHVIKTYESYMYLAKSYTKQCSFLKQLKLCSSRT